MLSALFVGQVGAGPLEGRKKLTAQKKQQVRKPAA
jgi:hypothetical protein